jgi:two-component system, NtrC family, sensor kinase
MHEWLPIKRMKRISKVFSIQRHHLAEVRNKFRHTPIATKLAINFVLIIVVISIIFTIVGIQLISNRIVAETQEKVDQDLNSARVIYQSKLDHIYDVVRLTANRFFIQTAMTSGDMSGAEGELIKVKKDEKLDILTITDASGKVIFRANNLQALGDSQTHNELVATVLSKKVPVSTTMIISAEDLRLESPLLAKQADILLVNTPKARVTNETQETSAMAIGSAAPIFDANNHMIGVMYGEVLLNRNYEIVDLVKQTVFQNMKYENSDIGTATIFQDDIRVSTNVRNLDGSRAIGTRVSEEVYNQVVLKGSPYIGRAYVVNNWYITAYEPIRDLNQTIIGIRYVGVLEQKYVDIKRQIVLVFMTITILGAIVSTILAYLNSLRLSNPIKKLASASKEVAQGNLKAKVNITSKDELGELANTFNFMATALQDRDEKLKEYTKNKIMESERLALIGQLSANVAHELNNPLQGIVTYSHLLLEAENCNEDAKTNLQKIVVQANRCRDIIRGLLDFSRHKNPDKTSCNVNSLLQGCISLVEKQAIFLNIKVVLNLEDNLPMVILDPSQVERVFLNLIINAAEAMDGNGTLTLTTKYGRKEKAIEIKVQDTGHGISKENISKVFDPFFTTKETGHGVGLGLAISYGIVKEHNGDISVESELEKGTTFTMSFPLKSPERGTADGN